MGRTRNLTLLVRVPVGVVTVTNPVVAPAGTVVIRKVFDRIVNVAGVPLNFTLLVPVNPPPKIPILTPTFPEVVTSFTKGTKATFRLYNTPADPWPPPVFVSP